MTEFPARDVEEAERVDEKRDKTPNRLATLSLKLGVSAFVGFFLFGFSVLTLADTNSHSYNAWIGFCLRFGKFSLAIFLLCCALPAIILGHVALFKRWRSVVPMAGFLRSITGLFLGYSYAFLTPFVADAIHYVRYDHRCSNELSGAGNLRTIAHAQTAYRAAHGIYAGSFAELTDDSKGPALLDGQWDEEDIPKNGYLFTLKSTDNGNGYEVTANLSEPWDGTYWFIDSSGVIRSNMAAPADSTSPALGEGRRIPWWRVWWRVRRIQRASPEQQP